MMLFQNYRRTLGVIGAVWILGAVHHVGAQPETKPTTDPTSVSTQVDTLRALLTSHAKAIESLAEQQKKVNAATAEASKEEALEQLEILEKQRQEIERDLMTIASGIDRVDYDRISATPEKVTVQEEIGQLLTPLLSDLRELTRQPRAIEALKRELDAQANRRDKAQKAIAELDRLLEELKASKRAADSSMRSYLTNARKQWQGNLDVAASRIHVIELQLDELKKNGGDFWTQLGRQIKSFVLTRGVSIALATLAFFTTFFCQRALYFYFLKYLPLRKYERLSFTVRMLDVLHHGVSATLAILAALMVLYARGDWLLGGLAIVGLGTLLFAAKSGVFRHMEQIRTLLNLGTAREGERVLIDGVPWKIGTINLFTQLTNPVIGGTGLRMPLDNLMAMTSRPCANDESWFPCRCDEWIRFHDGTLAQVMTLAPDHVELRLFGEQRRWISLSDFIKMEFTAMAKGFTLVTTFGIDYRHQALATREIPQQMTREIHEEMLKHVREEELQNLRVDFKEAGKSSLDFLIIASFTGNVASDYFGLSRLLQRFAVESCQRNNWGIPFPQMVVHQAAAAKG